MKNVAHIGMRGINAAYNSGNFHEKERLGNLSVSVKPVLKCVEINLVWIGVNWLKMAPRRGPFITQR